MDRESIKHTVGVIGHNGHSMGFWDKTELDGSWASLGETLYIFIPTGADPDKYMGLSFAAIIGLEHARPELRNKLRPIIRRTTDK